MKHNDIQTKLINAIDIVIGEKLKHLSFNYYIEGRVVDVSGNIATVTINGTNTTVPFRKGLSLSSNDIVLILVPNGNYSKKFIDLIRPY